MLSMGCVMMAREVTAMSGSAPALVRRELGRRLRQARVEAGRTVADVVRARIVAQPTLWRAESGDRPAKPGTVLSLCMFYGVDQEMTRVLHELALGAQQPGWWEQTYGSRLGTFSLYVGLESAACAIRSYYPDAVFGLLQTRAYAEAVERATQPGVDEETIQRSVDLRMRRQEKALGREQPPHITALMGFAALDNGVGGQEVMSAQVEHLSRMQHRDEVHIAVLPKGCGAHPGLMGAVEILDFDHPDDPAVVYVPGPAGARYLETPVELDRFAQLYQSIQAVSVPLEEYLS